MLVQKHIIKSMSFKFGQVNVSSKDFYKRKQFTDLFSLDYDKVVVSDPIQCNDGKDKRYVIGYETMVSFLCKSRHQKMSSAMD